MVGGHEALEVECTAGVRVKRLFCLWKSGYVDWQIVKVKS